MTGVLVQQRHLADHSRILKRHGGSTQFRLGWRLGRKRHLAIVVPQEVWMLYF